MSRKISQRQAQRLRKKLDELQRRESNNLHSWSSDWVGGVNICTVEPGDRNRHIISTARKLGHAVVVMPADNFKLLIYAVKP
jgi:hypothetical protein